MALLTTALTLGGLAMSVPTIAQAVKSLLDPGLSEAEVAERRRALESQLIDARRSMIAGGMDPEQANQAITSTYQQALDSLDEQRGTEMPGIGELALAAAGIVPAVGGIRGAMAAGKGAGLLGKAAEGIKNVGGAYGQLAKQAIGGASKAAPSIDDLAMAASRKAGMPIGATSRLPTSTSIKGMGATTSIEGMGATSPLRLPKAPPNAAGFVDRISPTGFTMSSGQGGALITSQQAMFERTMQSLMQQGVPGQDALRMAMQAAGL